MTLYRFFDDELSDLLDTVLAGEVVSDRATAERLVRSVGALVHLHQQHPVDARGRCGVCCPVRRWWRPWSKRSICTVHTALSFYLWQPCDSVLKALVQRKPDTSPKPPRA